MCDARSVDSSDLVEADHVRKQYSGSNYYAKPSQKYQWYYLNQQRVDEVTLLKMFDSADVEGKCNVLPIQITHRTPSEAHGPADTLHTSFDHQQLPENYVPRESIEVRALVFTHPASQGP
jgi:hypothetical protein